MLQNIEKAASPAKQQPRRKSSSEQVSLVPDGMSMAV